MKLNVDAAVFSSRSGAGTVVCDEERKLVGLWIFKLDTLDTMVAESFAIF